MRRGKTGTYRVVSSEGEKYRAFIPSPLPPDPPLRIERDLQYENDRALLSLGRLDSVTTLLPEVYYEDAFLRAFPGVLREVAPTTYSTPEKTVRSCYTWRVLVNFAVFLDLAEVEPTVEGRHDRHFRVKKRPLLTEAVRFHIPR